MDKNARSKQDADADDGIRIIGGEDVMDEGIRPGRSVFAADDMDDALDDDDSLPHWTEPPAGRSEGDSWSTITGAQPRWRDDRAVESDEDVEFEFVDDVDDSHDFFEFDDDSGNDNFLDLDLELDEQDFEEPPAVVALDSRRTTGARAAVNPGATRTAPKSPAASRDEMLQRVATGVALGALALVAFKVGPKATIVLLAVVFALAVVEFYNATRRAGYQPAALLGIVATAAMPLAIYWRGLDAMPLILFLTVAFSMLWFLIGVGNESPLLNVGVTVLGVLYIGVLGSFGALMLDRWGKNGIGILAGAIVATIAYDIGGLFIGRAMGRSPLSAASPNKTIEGLLGGMALCVIASTAVVSMWEPWGTWKHGFALGIGAAIAAPLGDLCESMLKRDLGVKDMGSILPGHGGLLDRFDAMLFVLPVAYEVARLLDLAIS